MTLPPPEHRPVLLEQTLAALDPQPGKLLLDGTVGLGGHSEAWLLRSGPTGTVIGFDRDCRALERARTRLSGFGERARLFHEDYREVPERWGALAAAAPDAVLLDLGLGSHQMDDPERGFSFRTDGPLDMRFDTSRPGPTAAELLAQAPERELSRILREYGEEPAAKKIARRIVDQRRRTPLRRTGELARLVREAVPAHGRRGRIDPATLTFQALRIAVNRELEGLDKAIEGLIRLLAPGGRVAVIAFHSLEDRVVKNALRRLATRRHRQPGDPPEVAFEPLIDTPVRKATLPQAEEIAVNPRSRSARLRWGIRR